MKLEIYNYFPDTTSHAKFQGPMSTWVVWANSQFDAWKFLSFFSFLSHAHRLHLWTHPNDQYVIMRRSRQGSAFWGLERLNLKFDPLYPKKRKNWDFKLARSMENCSRSNSGTVSRIMFKLSTRIDHPSGITWHDSKVKRAKAKVTT